MFFWTFGCLAVLLLVIVVTNFVLHTVVALVVAGFGLVLFFCVCLSFIFWVFYFLFDRLGRHGGDSTATRKRPKHDKYSECVHVFDALS